MDLVDSQRPYCPNLLRFYECLLSFRQICLPETNSSNLLCWLVSTDVSSSRTVVSHHNFRFEIPCVQGLQGFLESISCVISLHNPTISHSIEGNDHKQLWPPYHNMLSRQVRMAEKTRYEPLTTPLISASPNIATSSAPSSWPSVFARPQTKRQDIETASLLAEEPPELSDDLGNKPPARSFMLSSILVSFFGP